MKKLSDIISDDLNLDGIKIFQKEDLPIPFQLKLPSDSVTKRNDFVRFRLVMHRKDPLANRLFAHIVSCLHNRRDQTLGLCEVKLKDVMTWADSEKDYERVKKAVQVLGTSVVEVEDKNEKIYQLKRLFGDDITYYGKKGIIRTELNPTLKDFFLNLHEYYTTYGLVEFSCLRSFYSQRLFEIACSIKPKFEETFPLRKLQHMLDITEGSLLTYGNFKQKVLEPAKKEIIKYTNMKFNYEPIKEGRAVTEVKIRARHMQAIGGPTNTLPGF